MQGKDRATTLTSDYLKIIEERLNIRWSDDGDPICVIDELNIFTLQRLQNELIELLSSSHGDNAISDSNSYGKINVQTVGFGLVENFDRFVKTGFLLGSRVILWDFLASRLLSNIRDMEEYKVTVVTTCSELLQLKSIVESGGLVVLSHPIDWHDKTRSCISELMQKGDPSAANYGLVSTLSAIDAIPMHPYTIFDGDSIQWPLHPASLATHDYYSKGHYALHKAVNDMFDNIKFDYMNDVRAAEFYAIINKERQFYNEIKRLLSLPNPSASPQEIHSFTEDSLVKLSNLLEKRSKSIASNGMAIAGASLSVLACSMSLINVISTSGMQMPLNVAASLTNLSASLLRYLSNHFKNGADNVIVQTFYNLKQAPKYN